MSDLTLPAKLTISQLLNAVPFSHDRGCFAKCFKGAPHLRTLLLPIHTFTHAPKKQQKHTHRTAITPSTNPLRFSPFDFHILPSTFDCSVCRISELYSEYSNFSSLTVFFFCFVRTWVCSFFCSLVFPVIVDSATGRVCRTQWKLELAASA